AAGDRNRSFPARVSQPNCNLLAVEASNVTQVGRNRWITSAACKRKNFEKLACIRVKAANSLLVYNCRVSPLISHLANHFPLCQKERLVTGYCFLRPDSRPVAIFADFPSRHFLGWPRLNKDNYSISRRTGEGDTIPHTPLKLKIASPFARQQVGP